MLLKKLLLLVATLGLMSCSGTYRTYSDMLKLAFKETPDVQLPYSFLSDAPHDYLYVKQGERAQIAMGLMFVEREQLKWVSADRALLVTEHGRIVRTVGMANDLLYLTNLDNDPLKRKLNFAMAKPWLRLADWQQNEYGYQLRSTFQYGATELMTFFGVQLEVIPVIERVSYDNAANFVRFDDKWQNLFWLDAKSGEVLKSRQKLLPTGQQFELTFISKVVRQLQRDGKDVAADAI
ncbi:YjbF family lipoprotein [Arsukibacterium sp.]|uniref:YjbF family lipoprotein n=1 Tax=Arsukibacterium sp. TaxID=1977258 RepID=UPI00356831F3